MGRDIETPAVTEPARLDAIVRGDRTISLRLRVPIDLTLPIRPRGSETILLAEDSRPLRELARLTLERSGYTVLEAEDGETAIRIVETDDRPIHLLLTDVVMPGIGGRQAAEKILASRPTIKVVYMSGYTDDIVLRHGVVESGGAFLQKPFTTMALAQLIRTVLDGGGNVAPT